MQKRQEEDEEKKKMRMSEKKMQVRWPCASLTAGVKDDICIE